jgi:hypothetical protein
MYTLYFPFTLPEGRKITASDKPIKIGSLTFKLNVTDEKYGIKVSGFSTGLESRDFLNKLWAGMILLPVQRDLAPQNMSVVLQQIQYSEDPVTTGNNIAQTFGQEKGEPVDVLINSAHPAMYQSDKRIMVLSSVDGTVTLTSSGDDILQVIGNNALKANSERLATNKKMKIALELFSSYFIESSPNARFLCLMLAFEALTENIKRSKEANLLIDRWERELKEKLDTTDSKTDEYESLECLRRELKFKREESIRRAVQYLVKDTLDKAGELDAEEAKINIRKAYDARSELVHLGFLHPDTLNKMTVIANSILKRVLIAKFNKIINA